MTTLAFDARRYLARIWTFRHFWWALVANDIRSRYRRSLLGVGWSLLRPLGMTAVFCCVFGALLQRPIREYAPFVLIGMAAWQYLHEAVMLGCRSFLSGAAYIRQQQVPHAIFPLRTILGVGFQFLIALAVGVGLAIACGTVPGWNALLFLPAALAILFVAGWAVAVIAGVTATHFPDASHLLEIVMQFLFYLTPVMYSPGDIPGRAGLARFVVWNPAYAMIEMIRAPLLKSELPAPELAALCVGCTAAAVLVATALLRRFERTLVFWL
jgi:ABC-type polysaccharide/polyol phosphate export permease